MATGKVKWFNEKKGYGFITGDDGTDYFVHHTDLRMDGFRTVGEGDQVEFQTRKMPKGPQAVDVRTI